ncbi:MAG: hypothetical protein ACREFW_01640 [Rhizomicrobium sp.]
MRKSAFLLLLVLSACGPSASPDKEAEKPAQPGVTLTPDQVKSLGVETASIQSASFRRQVIGYGVVTAIDAIAQTDADFATASAAAAQSAAAAARARTLSTGEEAAVSREVLEAADSKAAADQAALALAQRKADSVFGIHAPWRTRAARAAIMARLTSGRTVLVRVTFPLGSLQAGLPAFLTITRLGGQERWTARTIWDAPGDPAFPGRGFYALVDGSDLAQNEHVIAAVPVGTSEVGVMVPASALLLGEGESSVYLEIGPGHYVRAQVPTDKPDGNSYFIDKAMGIKSGQQVVTQGAGLLLSREINPGGGGGDD